MDPKLLIPAADALPVAPWLFRVLLDATFVVHLLFMNALLGCVFVGLARSMTGGPGLSRQARLNPWLTALTVNIGVAPLLFVQTLYGQFFYVGSTLMAVVWFSLPLAILFAYALAYRQKYALYDETKTGTVLWALMSLILLYVSLFQTQNALLLVRPDLWQGYFDDPQGTLTAFADPTAIPRWLHFVAASLAMGGLVLAMIGRKKAKAGEAEGAAMRTEGLRWFGWAVIVQAAVGIWWLLRLPATLFSAFMGGDPLATGLLATGIAVAAASAVLAFRGRLMATAAAAVLTVADMTVLRGVLRDLYLAPVFKPDDLPIVPELSSVILFFICLIISLAATAYAVKDLKPAAKEG